MPAAITPIVWYYKLCKNLFIPQDLKSELSLPQKPKSAHGTAVPSLPNLFFLEQTQRIHTRVAGREESNADRSSARFILIARFLFIVIVKDNSWGKDNLPWLRHCRQDQESRAI